MEAHVCMRKKVAGYIFPVQLSSRVVLQLLIRRIYKLLDAYTGYAEFFFLLVIGVGCAEATGCARSWLQACYVLGVVSGTKKKDMIKMNGCMNCYIRNNISASKHTKMTKFMCSSLQIMKKIYCPRQEL